MPWAGATGLPLLAQQLILVIICCMSDNDTELEKPRFSSISSLFLKVFCLGVVLVVSTKLSKRVHREKAMPKASPSQTCVLGCVPYLLSDPEQGASSVSLVPPVQHGHMGRKARSETTYVLNGRESSLGAGQLEMVSVNRGMPALAQLHSKVASRRSIISPFRDKRGGWGIH